MQNPLVAQSPTRLERTVVYESRWVNLYRDRVQLANDHIIEQYHIVELGRGAVVVIVEDAIGQILMEQASRYPTGTTTWELPAGGIDAGETPRAAAAREVLEETGYITTQHTELYVYHPLNGISNSTVHIVHCRCGVRAGAIDQNEIDAVRWFTPQEITALIQQRAITDGLALTALLLHGHVLAHNVYLKEV